jgi:hypothetical protein
MCFRRSMGRPGRSRELLLSATGQCGRKMRSADINLCTAYKLKRDGEQHNDVSDDRRCCSYGFDDDEEKRSKSKLKPSDGDGLCMCAFLICPYHKPDEKGYSVCTKPAEVIERGVVTWRFCKDCASIYREKFPLTRKAGNVQS